MIKLIRDNIPEICKKSGVKLDCWEIASKDDYLKFLNKKLEEEMLEYKTSGELIELVDIVTVIYAILSAQGCSKDTFEELYKQKLTTNGGFEKRIVGRFEEKD